MDPSDPFKSTPNAFPTPMTPASKCDVPLYLPPQTFTFTKHRTPIKSLHYTVVTANRTNEPCSLPILWYCNLQHIAVAPTEGLDYLKQR